jgi:hypothetical protein
MRFSSIFQPTESAPRKPPGDAATRAEKEQGAAAVPIADLPDDLDARVRLVGEWQQLEG